MTGGSSPPPNFTTRLHDSLNTIVSPLALVRSQAPDRQELHSLRISVPTGNVVDVTGSCANDMPIRISEVSLDNLIGLDSL